MNTPRRLRTIVALSLITAASFSLAACSDDSGSDSGSSTTTASEIPAPVIVDITTLDGTTVTVPMSNVVVINADAPATWTATIADPSIASFTPGSDDGSASFNPGLQPKAAGSTTVTITDGTTTVTFTLDVTA